jgi:prephenate dehydrogenase
MNSDFPNVTILGSGLLGGSLALALTQLENPPCVRLWARKQETALEAQQLGLAHAASDLATALQQADLIVLAVPIGAMAALMAEALQCGLSAACLVTDVGSVKGTPHRELVPLLAPHGISFIGSHPMAGSERNGLLAAHANLFEDAACLLTNDEHTDPGQAAALERFWKSVGCRTTWLSPENHDHLVARISHLPHLIAASAARVCLKNPADGCFGGGGLRDTTRIAGGNPAMWAEIVMENRAALIGPLQESIADLREILASLENKQQEQARSWLDAAKQLRDPLNRAI